MIVYLIRHGHTPLCGTDCLRGRLDEPMDETGRAGAQRLAQLFERVELEAIVTSPLARALETGQAIACPHDLRPTTHAGLIDRAFGPWEGKPRKLVEDRYGTIDNAPTAEIEPQPEVARRALAAWEELTRDRAERNLAIVTHEAVIKALIGLHCDNCRERDETEIKQPLCGWNRIVFKGASWHCDVVGAEPGDGTRP